MLLHSVLITIYALPALIRGKQIPFVDGVFGGVPSPEACNFEIPKGPISDNAPSPPTPGKLRGVVENSGICETTSGVYQASGYGDVDNEKSIWFWFFAARNNPDKAPLITWFNGGPGRSSMYGLFEEIGPCFINNQSTEADLNPMSWTNVANVLFIDQPVGVGFSYGDSIVGTTRQATVDVWSFLQIWFADPRFSKYASRDFGIWTELYGGHYGPAFAAYFLQQNAAIRFGTLKATYINLKVLGIGNPYVDPLSQYFGYIQYAQSNPYHALVNSSVIATADTAWSQSGGCRDQIIACNNGGSDAVCLAADTFCDKQIRGPLSGIWDTGYVLSKKPDPYPPNLGPYLSNSAVTSKIGSQSAWVWRNLEVFNQFVANGEWIRSSSLNLELVINAGVRTVIYDGDASYEHNFKGVEAMVASLYTVYSSLYAAQQFSTFKVKGKPAGQYKNAGRLSYLRVNGAGVEVPAYGWRDVSRGAAALQMFTQIMSDKTLSST